MKNKKRTPGILPETESMSFSAAVGMPSFRMTGDKEVVISGVNLIKSYSEEEISLDLDRIFASICGVCLLLVFLGEGVIKIEGRITCVSLERRK